METSANKHTPKKSHALVCEIKKHTETLPWFLITRGGWLLQRNHKVLKSALDFSYVMHETGRKIHDFLTDTPLSQSEYWQTNVHFYISIYINISGQRPVDKCTPLFCDEDDFGAFLKSTSEELKTSFNSVWNVCVRHCSNEINTKKKDKLLFILVICLCFSGLI